MDNYILVTGSNGKIGIRIVSFLLENNFSVIALFNKNNDKLKKMLNSKKFNQRRLILFKQ